MSCCTPNCYVTATARTRHSFQIEYSPVLYTVVWIILYVVIYNGPAFAFITARGEGISCALTRLEPTTFRLWAIGQAITPPTPYLSLTTRYYFRTSGNSYLFLSSVFYYLFFPCYESEFDLITLNLQKYRDWRSDFFAWYWAYKSNYIFETVRDMYQLSGLQDPRGRQSILNPHDILT